MVEGVLMQVASRISLGNWCILCIGFFMDQYYSNKLTLSIVSKYCLFQGSVKKRTLGDRWVRRYLILYHRAICYYKCSNEDSMPCKIILIDDVDVESISDPIEKNRKCLFSFSTVSENRTYCFKASREMAEEWNRQLRKVILEDDFSADQLCLSSQALLLNEFSLKDHQQWYHKDKDTVTVKNSFYNAIGAFNCVYNFISSLCLLFERDYFLDLKMKIRELLCFHQETEINSQLEECERPCFMLNVDEKRRINPDLDPRLYICIENLVGKLDVWASKITNEELMDAINELKLYYKNTIDKFMRIGYRSAQIPPNEVIIISRIRPKMQLLIFDECLYGILNAPRQPYGVNKTTYYRGVYWKIRRSNLGVEYAVYLLSRMVTNLGCPPSILLKVNLLGEKRSIFMVASKEVRGELVSVFLADPSKISLIDHTNFCLMFVISLLVLPQDGKCDNYIVSMDKSTDSLHFSCIDNNHVFSDSVCFSKSSNGHFINVRCILFCLPQADNEFDRMSKDILLSLSPELLVVLWLAYLNDENIFYRQLLNEGILTREEVEELGIFIRLRRSISVQIYLKLLKIQRILTKSPFVTPNQLFRRLYPLLYEYYSYQMQVNCSSFNWAQVFSEHIFQGKNFEQFPKLLARQLHNGMTVREALASRNKGPFEYESSRNRQPLEELEELLSYMDFGHVPEDVQREIIKKLKTFSFFKFTIINSNVFTENDLTDILANSRSLVKLELCNCPLIKNIDCVYLHMTHPELILRNMEIDNEEITKLKQYGIQLKILNEPNDNHSFLDDDDDFYPPSSQGNTGEAKYEIMNLLEFIRTGDYKNACEKMFLFSPESLRKYQSWIECSISNEQLASSKSFDFVKLLILKTSWSMNNIKSSGECFWHLAVREGDLEFCEFLMNNGADINIKNHLNRTPLHIAVIGRHVNVVKVLCIRNCLLDEVDKDGNSALSLTLLLFHSDPRAYESIFSILLESGARLDLIYANGNTILHLAIEKKMNQLALKLLDKDINLQAQNDLGETSLHLACKLVSNTANSMYVDTNNSGLIAEDKRRQSFFSISYYTEEELNSSLNLIKSLISRGASIKSMTNKGSTVLHYCIRGGSPVVLNYVFCHSKCATIVDDKKNNLFHELSEQKSWICMNLFFILAFHLDLKELGSKNIYDKTPMMTACQSRNTTFIHLALFIQSIYTEICPIQNSISNFKTDVQSLRSSRNHTPPNDSNPLLTRHENLNSTFVELFDKFAAFQNSQPSDKFSHGPLFDIDDVDANENSALMICVELNFFQGVEILINYGANPNLWNNLMYNPTWRSVMVLYKDYNKHSNTSQCSNSESLECQNAPSKYHHHHHPSYIEQADSKEHHHHHSRLKTSEYLISHGGILHGTTPDGKNFLPHLIINRVLMDPISCPGILEIEFLSKNEASLFELNSEKQTIIHLICKSKMDSRSEEWQKLVFDLLDLLFEYSRDPNDLIFKEDIHEKTCLHLAIDSNNNALIMKLAEYCGSEGNWGRRKKEANPLFYAIKYSSIETAKTVLQAYGSFLPANRIKECLPIAKDTVLYKLIKDIK